MLKPRHVFLGLAILVAFLGDSRGQSRRQPPANQTPKTQQATPQDQRGTKDQPLTVNVIPTAEQQAAAEKESTDAKLKASRDDKLIDYTGELVLVGIVQFLVFVLQLIAFVVQANYMRRSAAEMRKTTEAAEKVSQDQIAHSHQIERAFLCGGGGLKIHPNDSIFFGLDVQNYGKTPASLKAYVVCICDRDKLPSVPEYMTPGYKRETFFDEIPPSGGPTKLLRLYPVIDAHYGTKVVYGRFWYQDIWNEDHFFSFILSIAEKEGRGFGTHADVSEASPEYTNWT